MVGRRLQGVALLDPAHPDNARLRRELPPKVFRRSGSDLAVGLRMGRTAARLHVIGALKPLITKGPPFSYCRQHPPEALKSMWRHMTRAQSYGTALEEYEELEFRTRPYDLEALGPFPRVPLTVLVHDPEVMIRFFVKSARLPLADAQEVERLWGRLLRDNASLSPLTKVETVTGSGHLIHPGEAGADGGKDLWTD